jgi:hypothetical protein
MPGRARGAEQRRFAEHIIETVVRLSRGLLDEYRLPYTAALRAHRKGTTRAWDAPPFAPRQLSHFFPDLCDTRKAAEDRVEVAVPST